MTSIPRPCVIEGCEKNNQAFRLCPMHYSRMKKYGDPLKVKIPHQLHGLHKTRLYNTWLSIRGRTTNPNYKQYEDYGGRGIKMCKGWWDSFKDFHDDIGERPSKEYSLDRIDNDKGYTCGRCRECIDSDWKLNVRWATRQQQQLNQRHRKNQSGYRGVRTGNGRFIARIRHGGTEYYIGRYDTAEEAALAYDRKAVELYGTDANLNVIP